GHVPLVAMGPGVVPGLACSTRRCVNDLRNRLSEIGPGDVDPLVDFLNCEGPPSDLIVTHGFAEQLALSTEHYRYIRYDTGQHYPIFAVATGRSVRDRRLDGEALFDLRDDPENTRNVALERAEELATFRRLAAIEER